MKDKSFTQLYLRADQLQQFSPNTSSISSGLLRSKKDSDQYDPVWSVCVQWTEALRSVTLPLVTDNKKAFWYPGWRSWLFFTQHLCQRLSNPISPSSHFSYPTIPKMLWAGPWPKKGRPCKQGLGSVSWLSSSLSSWTPRVRATAKTQPDRGIVFTVVTPVLTFHLMLTWHGHWMLQFCVTANVFMDSMGFCNQHQEFRLKCLWILIHIIINITVR